MGEESWAGNRGSSSCFSCFSLRSSFLLFLKKVGFSMAVVHHLLLNSLHCLPSTLWGFGSLGRCCSLPFYRKTMEYYGFTIFFVRKRRLSSNLKCISETNYKVTITIKFILLLSITLMQIYIYIYNIFFHN